MKRNKVHAVRQDKQEARMDIYEYAMQMEKDGEAYYRDLAGKTSHQGLKSILGMLADAEVKHYKLFEDIHQDP